MLGAAKSRLGDGVGGEVERLGAGARPVIPMYDLASASRNP